MANLSPQIRLLLPGFLLTLSIALNLASAFQDDTALTPGRGFEKELLGGKTHTYKISVAAKHYLRVVVEQRGIIIMATLKDSEGKALAQADNPSGAYGPIYLSSIPQSAGEYRVEVRSTESWANPGRYKIAIEKLQPATPADSERLGAEQNYLEGRHLIEGRVTRESANKRLTEALEKFGAAFSYWQREGDPHWIALIEYCLATTHRSLGDRPTAAKHFDNSLAIKVDEIDWRLKASVLNDRGANLWRLNKEQEALASLDEAFKLFKMHNDRRGQASVFNNIGFGYLLGGRYRDANEILNKALPLRRAENDRSNEAALFSNIASGWERIGETRKALQGYSEALRIWEELSKQGNLNNPLRLAVGFNNVALAYDRLGEWQKALENYEKALLIYGKNPLVEAASTLDNIGELYAVLGDSNRAMAYYKQAESLSKNKDTRVEANILTHLGELYVSKNDLKAALTYFERSLALREDAASGRANALTNIGVVHTLERKPLKALESYEAALALMEGGEDRRTLAFTLQKIGEARALLKQPGKALEALNRALPMWRDLADKRGEASTLYTIALVERDRGNLAEALERSKQSLNIIEALRTKVASQRLRSSFFASQQSHYELYIDLRMRLYRNDKSADHLAATIEASERSRARSLVDTLSEAGANISRGMNEELITLEREAQQRVNDKEQVQMQLLNRKHSRIEATNIERELSEAIAEYDAIKARIRASSPDYAQLTQPRSLSLSEMQQLLDNDTLLLHYFLGDERSYLWLVSRTSIVCVDSLPKRAEIETSAEAFYKSLAQRPASQNPSRLNKAAEQANAISLSQMLLGPIADRLGNKRLLIVSDGVLQYLPFSALPAPRVTGGAGRRLARSPYLIEKHEIVYLPSASTLAVLRSKALGRELGPLSVAVFAHPVFTRRDARLTAAKQSPTTSEVSGAESPAEYLHNRGIERSGLDSLPATDYEAEWIKAIFAKDRTTIFRGFEASRDRVIKLQGEKFRIVHFATHGQINTEHPELSSIVLSLFDAEGKEQNGYLRLHDIYNLKLPADLIVLSACTTGLGRIVRGEGLVGLTRGFMHAGSPRIVASLWQVEDLGTANLMKRFYQHMAKDGMAPALALRQAQVEMLRDKQWTPPYYWAGFVLQGEWTPIR